jgi:hypothetical protein
MMRKLYQLLLTVKGYNEHHIGKCRHILMKMLYDSSGGNLLVTNLKIRWIEAVEQDDKKIPSIRNLKREAMDRQGSRGYLWDNKAR